MCVFVCILVSGCVDICPPIDVHNEHVTGYEQTLYYGKSSYKMVKELSPIAYLGNVSGKPHILRTNKMNCVCEMGG